MSAGTLQFIHGALMFGCFVIGLKFLKYWRLSRDRFFIYFAASFVIFAAGWGLRASSIVVGGEHGHLVFVPRLVGFLLILVAIFDKNRHSSTDE